MSSIPVPLTWANRFLWMLALIGAFCFVVKFLGISARQEMFFEETLGDSSKHPALVHAAFQWQRLLGTNFLFIIMACLPVLIWIGFAKSARRVQTLVLLIAGFLVLQAIISVVIPYPAMYQRVRALSQMPKSE